MLMVPRPDSLQKEITNVIGFVNQGSIAQVTQASSLIDC